MTPSKTERVARMQVLAVEFRGFAAQTHLEDYRILLLEAALELDREAARLDGYDRPALAS